MQMNQNQLNSFRKKFQATLDDNYYTDDQAVLNRYEYVPLFVYGTLKKNFPLQAHLESSRYIGMAHTLRNNFVMYTTKNPLRMNFPIIFHNNVEGERGHVAGELYMVRPWTIAKLDFIEQNGLSYHRDYVSLKMVDYRYPKGDKFWAYTYIGDPDWWDTKMLQGDIAPVTRFTRNKDKTYHYYTYLHQTNPNLLRKEPLNA